MLNQRLKFLRNSKGTTQKQMADLLGLKSDRAYRYYESGELEPNIENIIKLCNYFNVSADYLLGLSDDPTRH